jgi:hypothetical protein
MMTIIQRRRGGEVNGVALPCGRAAGKNLLGGKIFMGRNFRTSCAGRQYP